MAANPLIVTSYEDQLIRQHNQQLARLLIAVSGTCGLLALAVCVLIFRPRTLPYLVMVNGRGDRLVHPQRQDRHR
jgi:hypothetical protein